MWESKKQVAEWPGGLHVGIEKLRLLSGLWNGTWESKQPFVSIPAYLPAMPLNELPKKIRLLGSARASIGESKKNQVAQWPVGLHVGIEATVEI